jgi:predicted kinase
MAERAGFTLISSDEVRKELAGIGPGTSARAGFGEGIYTAEWNRRTYAECLRRAEAVLFQGDRAVVDASFREERYRRDFLDLAARCCVEAVIFHRTADPGPLRHQVESRRDTVSDADWGVSREVLRRWEAFGADTARLVREIPRQPTAAGVWELAEEELKRAGLF